MRLRDVLIGTGVIILIVFILAALFYTVPAEEGQNETAGQAAFNIIEMGRAGNYGYVIYDMRGDGELKIISYRRRGFKEITIINDSEGVEASRLPELVSGIEPIEKYGYTVEVSDRRMLGKGIFVVATGGMPNYVLDDIRGNITDSIILYIGRKDLVIHSGVMSNENWYDGLTAAQKDRIYIYEKNTLGAYLDAGNDTMVTDILENRWSYDDAATYNISGDGKGTRKMLLNNSKYIRVLYNVGNYKGIVDSVELKAPDVVLLPQPESIYPWETAELTYGLGKTNGTAYFTVSLNGVETTAEMLRRVSEESVFIKRLKYREPGEYVLVVKDNEGVVASGILHVKGLEIVYAGKSMNRYSFNVTVDGEPLKGAEVYATLNNSTEKKKFYVSGGELTIGAVLQKGENVFNIEIEGTTYSIPVTSSEEKIWDVYVKYGLPGILIVFIVYVVARLSKRPAYILRIPEGSREIRREVRVKRDDVIGAVAKMREDLRMKRYPITVAEFEMAVKRYITNGADVTEGNVEEMLRKLAKDGLLEQYGEYCQPTGEGQIREKAILRRIRENLIENGASFKEAGNKFLAKDYDIGLYGEKYDRKAIIVVENDDEIEKIMSSLGERERVELRIKQANGLVSFVKVNKLSEAL